MAFNIRRARNERGWTQEQAAEALAPYLGVKWTGPAFSVAERWNPKPGQKVRRYDPDELAALALGFGLPVEWFFVPPADTGEGDTDLSAVRLPGEAVPMHAYAAHVATRTSLEELLHGLEVENKRTEANVQKLRQLLSRLSEAGADEAAGSTERQRVLSSLAEAARRATPRETQPATAKRRTTKRRTTKRGA